MKNLKRIISILTILSLISGIFAFIESATATYPAPDETALFAYLDEITLTTSGTYTFDVKIQNKEGVTTIAFDLHFDTDYVNITDIQANPEGELPGGSLLIGNWDPATGVIEMITYGILGDSWDITTPVSVIRVTVEVLNFTPPSGTVIDIYNMDCYDKDLNNFLTGDSPYDHILEFPTPPPSPPTAEFTWTPMFPTEGETVSFDASASTQGFDGSQFCPITQYWWDWENDGVIDDNDTDPYIDHVFATAGTYEVNLTVYAPPGPSPDPSYVPYDSIVYTITVTAPPVGRGIDLFTQDTRHPGYTTPYTGENFFGGQVDSFAPQDLVILFAKVTYNNEPVANKEVAFEVHGPPNQYQNISIYRQAFTNAEGIANITFRIPWPDQHAEDIVFGNWTAMAKVDIAEEWVMDAHWFYVHWIIDIINVELYDNMNNIRVDFEELSNVFINTTVFNWAMTPRNVTITIVIYDELGVPFGTAVVNYVNIPPGETELDRVPVLVSIFIPEWAYVGWGTVYVNAFTKLPWDCGVCYCPEYSTPIQIKPGP